MFYVLYFKQVGKRLKNFFMLFHVFLLTITMLQFLIYLLEMWGVEFRATVVSEYFCDEP